MSQPCQQEVFFLKRHPWGKCRSFNELNILCSLLLKHQHIIVSLLPAKRSNSDFTSNVPESYFRGGLLCSFTASYILLLDYTTVTSHDSQFKLILIYNYSSYSALFEMSCFHSFVFPFKFWALLYDACSRISFHYLHSFTLTLSICLNDHTKVVIY